MPPLSLVQSFMPRGCRVYTTRRHERFRCGRWRRETSDLLPRQGNLEARKDAGRRPAIREPLPEHSPEHSMECRSVYGGPRFAAGLSTFRQREGRAMMISGSTGALMTPLRDRGDEPCGRMTSTSPVPSPQTGGLSLGQYETSYLGRPRPRDRSNRIGRFHRSAVPGETESRPHAFRTVWRLGRGQM